MRIQSNVGKIKEGDVVLIYRDNDLYGILIPHLIKAIKLLGKNVHLRVFVRGADEGQLIKESRNLLKEINKIPSTIVMSDRTYLLGIDYKYNFDGIFYALTRDLISEVLGNDERHLNNSAGVSDLDLMKELFKKLCGIVRHEPKKVMIIPEYLADHHPFDGYLREKLIDITGYSYTDEDIREEDNEGEIYEIEKDGAEIIKGWLLEIFPNCKIIIPNRKNKPRDVGYLEIDSGDYVLRWEIEDESVEEFNQVNGVGMVVIDRHNHPQNYKELFNSADEVFCLKMPFCEMIRSIMEWPQSFNIRLDDETIASKIVGIIKERLK